MLDTIFGLPIHPLIVHATVVVVPTAGLAVLLSAVWPRFREWAGWLTPALAATAVVLTPLSTSSGESLESHVGSSHLVEEHAELADMLIYWVVALLIGGAAVWWLNRRRSGVPRRGLLVAALVLSVGAGLGTIVQTVLIGHSGAKAAWSDVVSQSATADGGSDQGDGD